MGQDSPHRRQAHKIHKWIAQDQVRVEHCPTSAQLADALTKALPVHTHQHLKMHILGEAYKHYATFNPDAAPAAA